MKGTASKFTSLNLALGVAQASSWDMNKMEFVIHYHRHGARTPWSTVDMSLFGDDMKMFLPTEPDMLTP